MFTIVDPPTKGTFVRDGNKSLPVEAFTFTDIEDGRIAYQPSELYYGLVDNAEIQIDADNVQSARFRSRRCSDPEYTFSLLKKIFFSEEKGVNIKFAKQSEHDK